MRSSFAHTLTESCGKRALRMCGQPSCMRLYNSRREQVALHALAESLSLEQIATLLGHANKKTTNGYVHKK